MKRKEINEILEHYQNEGKIEDWGISDYSYWHGIPYVIIKNKEIFLSKEYVAYRLIVYHYNLRLQFY